MGRIDTMGCIHTRKHYSTIKLVAAISISMDDSHRHEDGKGGEAMHKRACVT